jgi:polar amino acid transport system substrate-binding protein
MVLLCTALLSVFFFCVANVRAEGVTASKNILERPLVVGITNDPPFTIKVQEGVWEGLNVEIWNYLAREMNVSFVLKEFEPAEMVRRLGAGEIDLTICSLYVSADRARIFDFSVPIGSSRVALATLPDKIEHPVWGALRIFLSWGTVKVVASLAFLLFLAGLVVWLIERKRNPESFGGGPIRGLISGVYWVGSTLASGVCVGINLKSLPGRIVGLLWMFICALVLSAFVAGLTSSLTLTRLNRSIDAKALRSLRLGAISGSIYAATLNKMHIRYRSFQGLDDALKAVLDNSIDGLLYGETTLRYYTQRDYRKRLSVYPIAYRRLPYAFGIAPGSPLHKPLNVALLKFMEDPLWEPLLERFDLSDAAPESDGFVRHRSGR